MIYLLDQLKLKTKNQNIFWGCKSKFDDFFYALLIEGGGGIRKQKGKKVFFFKVYDKVESTKKLVFSF